jgi:RiboL-PSP-HEPN
MYTGITLRSRSFDEYISGWREVTEILRAIPRDRFSSRSRRPQVSTALLKGCVVLLSSHLERYVESLASEAIDVMNAISPKNHLVPRALRMLHLEQPINSISNKWPSKNSDRFDQPQRMQERVEELRSLMVDCHFFFGDDELCGKLDSDLLIGDFANPSPERIIKLFRYFGINNVVGKAISLDQKPDRGILDKKVDELITKRHSIAHTGSVTDLTREDVVTYLRCSRRLVRGIDIVVGQTIEPICGEWTWVMSRKISVV